jgi:hypothetical protein
VLTGILDCMIFEVSKIKKNTKTFLFPNLLEISET